MNYVNNPLFWQPGNSEAVVAAMWPWMCCNSSSASSGTSTSGGTHSLTGVSAVVGSNVDQQRQYLHNISDEVFNLYSSKPWDEISDDKVRDVCSKLDGRNDVSEIVSVLTTEYSNMTPETMWPLVYHDITEDTDNVALLESSYINVFPETITVHYVGVAQKLNVLYNVVPLDTVPERKVEKLVENLDVVSKRLVKDFNTWGCVFLCFPGVEYFCYKTLHQSKRVVADVRNILRNTDNSCVTFFCEPRTINEEVVKNLNEVFKCNKPIGFYKNLFDDDDSTQRSYVKHREHGTPVYKSPYYY